MTPSATSRAILVCRAPVATGLRLRTFTGTNCAPAPFVRRGGVPPA